ncbi:HD-GYP domain-containing protein [uncultured Methylobacterium sp.]|uniref:HD-GYP domain-containing protein n=1 Tax=uncultured Methylobacterium sp. TaxID=157278 RepID=UPI0035C97D29
MRADTLVLFTDQTDRSAVLAETLDQIAPCRVLSVGDTDANGACLGLVADVDLLRPATVRGLRTLLATVRRPGLPFICLTRRMGNRSLAEARALGAGLSLPVDTAPETVAEALLAHLQPPRSIREAKVARGVDRAGTALTRLLDTARAHDTVDAATVEGGLGPILTAVGAGGLACWLDTVRSYDDGTYQHCLLVAGLAARFSIDLGFSAADQQQLVRAALVHDVGKARIPLDILNKPGRLDPDEVAIMRTHAGLGHEILVAAGGFDAPTLAVVRHHHEMLDGSGYPDGLAGSEIGDIVRLTTICDIYAALVERRPYRAPMRSADAMAVLTGMAGKLDAALVRAFARTVAKT